ncbi:SGNH/GDSL hydrolase family protein [Pedobacter alluvionis]|uniref:GDSL-like Lipase/Acylhydrolase family protein n=1 Tax=Pedobacter alluvionis TaxID=475253 RepID=A0A497YBT1_9SPHI|nr:hypothetical protein [Pedobacter alluvionis]RLJ80351.1 GDSL-like Lipase/Acylhydrolase family protein [Pedobacter alluvionis]TFB31622.1 hypothetical protein E3V97_13650 [Pedobacter alluvionis]
MANNENLKNAISAVIKSNRNNEITGDILKDAFISIINQFGAGAIIAGWATPTTVPIDSDINAVYFANTNGTYTNFGGYVLTKNEFVVFSNKTGSYSPIGIIEKSDPAIAAWTPIAFSIGSQVTNVGKIWKANAATLSTDVPGTSSKWVELGSAYVDETNIKNLLSLSPPPAQGNIILNDPGTYNQVTFDGFIGTRYYASVKPTYYAGAFNGVVKRFFVGMKGAEIGRVVRFYVLGRTGTTYLCKYESGDVAAELAGLNSYNPTVMPTYTVGDVIAIKVVAAEGSNIKFLDAGATEECIVFFNPLSVGNSVTVSSGLTRRYDVGAEITEENNLVSYKWGNQPNGYSKLDSSGFIEKKQLPNQITGDKAHNETPTTIYLPNKKSYAIARISGGVENYSLTNSTIGGTKGSGFNNIIIIPYEIASKGFVNGGILNEVRIGANTNVLPTSKLQAWIVRVVSGRINLVEKVGEIDGSVAGRWHVFKGLSVIVQSGDLVAIRGVNLPMDYYSGSTGQTPYSSYLLTSSAITDMTLNVFDEPITAPSSGGGVGFAIEADISLSSMGAKDNPGGSPSLDNNLHFKNSIGKAPDLFWQGKKIIWVGTSIPAGNDGGFLSYPEIAGRYLDANLTNESVGSSGMVWDGTRALSLSAKAAELVAAFGVNSGTYSYETKLIGKNADLIVFDHGYNDRLKVTGSFLGTLPFTSRTGKTSGSISSQILTGVNTLFSTEFKAGDKLYDFRFRYIGKVLSIESNTSMTLTENSLVAVSNADVFYGTSMDRTTFYGSFNYVIDKCYEDKPSVSIMFVTSPTAYAYQQTGADGRVTNTNARDAVIALANAYNAPCCDLFNLMGYNGSNWPAKMADSVHPNGSERVKIANILYGFIKNFVV